MRKVFLEELPRKYGIGSKKNNLVIDWIKCVGCNVKFIYDDIKGEIEIIKYVSKTQKLTIKYNDVLHEVITGNFMKCKIGKLINKKTNEFKIEIGYNIKDNKRDMTITDRKYIKNKFGQNKKMYKYKCNKCGFDCGKHWSLQDKCYKDEYLIEESKLKTTKRGCACCGSHIVVKGINDVLTIFPDSVKHFVNIEDAHTHTFRSSDEILFKCVYCNSTRKMKMCDFYKYGFRCLKCGDGISYSERFMFSLLKELNIDFICQYNKTNSKWCNNYRYDFYFKLKEEEFILETHGGQHYMKGFESCGGKNLEEVQQNDKNKYNLAINNGIKEENYIIIDCRYSEPKFIENSILNSRLNEIFDLDVINWSKISKESEKNLVKEICNYWHIHNEINNEGLTTKIIGEIFHMNKSTIIKYLKNGSKLGWCNYNSKEEMKRIDCKNGRKQVEIFKNGKSLGVFPSCAELSRQSEELFGVKLWYGSISKACKGEYINYKGYMFKYVDSKNN